MYITKFHIIFYTIKIKLEFSQHGICKSKYLYSIIQDNMQPCKETGQGKKKNLQKSINNLVFNALEIGQWQKKKWWHGLNI